ncbi:hypothetical protein ABIA69_003126 [Lysinibacillus parviboronicapiens]|uniref:Uncharacterized protein n=1 Tax=Lysinibacillus parviboronicapiens TaxID=436516 RepID=A0ABV2PLZ2_9BACI
MSTYKGKGLGPPLYALPIRNGTALSRVFTTLLHFMGSSILNLLNKGLFLHVKEFRFHYSKDFHNSVVVTVSFTRHTLNNPS